MSHPLAPYRPLALLLDDATRLCRDAGGDVAEYGHSEGGRPLIACRLPGTTTGGDDVRQVMISANLHGPEYISAEVALGALATASSGLLADLRQEATVWVLPCLNPDGYARTWDAEGQGAMAQLRTNDHGVDLNRNFPLPPGIEHSRLPGQGSNRHGDATYRGTGPLSEAEARHLAQFLDENRMWASANGHSFMGTCIPPRVTDKHDVAAYKRLCRAFADGQDRHRYLRLASVLFDGFTGELEDFQHHKFGTWAITVESFPFWASVKQHLRAPSLFWRFNPRDPAPWVANDVPGVVAFLRAALAMDAPQQQLG